jgi:hypothetical protein
MQDLDLAKKQLYSKQLTLAIAKNGQVLYQTDSHRISGVIHAIDSLGTELKGASVADKVAGKALALLCIYAGVREVYAEVLSKTAKALFQEYQIDCHWQQLVDNVLDLNKTGVCPLEKAAADISNPKDSYRVFKALMEKMKSCK